MNSWLNKNLNEYSLLSKSILIVILVSIISIFIGTIHIDPSTTYNEKYQSIFFIIEVTALIIFSIEYLLRVISITENEEYKNNRYKYMYNDFYMIIDLIVIVTGILSLIFMEWEFVGFLRAFRILRIFKFVQFTEYRDFIDTLYEIISENKNKFIVVILISFVMIVICAPTIYYVEQYFNPKQTPFVDIFTSIYWIVITFTTIGYGDITPVSAIGKFITTIISFLGIAFYAIPGALITSSLLEKIRSDKTIITQLKESIINIDEELYFSSKLDENIKKLKENQKEILETALLNLDPYNSSIFIQEQHEKFYKTMKSNSKELCMEKIK